MYFVVSFLLFHLLYMEKRVIFLCKFFIGEDPICDLKDNFFIEVNNLIEEIIDV